MSKINKFIINFLLYLIFLSAVFLYAQVTDIYGYSAVWELSELCVFVCVCVHACACVRTYVYSCEIGKSSFSLNYFALQAGHL